MKRNKKELILLLWNSKTGEYDRYILNKALKQNIKGELHVIIGDKIGSM